MPFKFSLAIVLFRGKNGEQREIWLQRGRRLEAPNLWRFGYNSVFVQLKLGKNKLKGGSSKVVLTLKKGLWMAKNMMLKWHKKCLSSSTYVPARPGLYIIGHSENYYGAEVERIYAYVGKTHNLSRRLREHAPENEKNLDLKNYLLGYFSRASCWYAFVGKSELDEIEGKLIHKLQPLFNQMKK